MTVEEAKQLKEGQEIYYKGIVGFPEIVKISKIEYDKNNKIEIHLEDNCYIPERDLSEYVFLTIEECIKACEKEFKEKLDKLKNMLKKEK